MEMTNAEIVRDYRSAKDKKEQIKILSELNCVPVPKIVEILKEAGEKVDGRLANGGDRKSHERTTKEPQKSNLPKCPDIVKAYISQQIAALEDEQASVQKEIDSLTEAINKIVNSKKELQAFLVGVSE